MSHFKRLITPTLCYRGIQQAIRKAALHNVALNNINITSRIVNFCPERITINPIRFKSKKHQVDSDDEEDIFDDDSSLRKDSKVVKFNTTSMRTDIIIKSALGVARNKIETLFYESKIRINGKKILKKSTAVKLGDEVDIIKMVSPNNPDHLYVARVEILNIVPKEDSISITARRFKNLLIENYDADPHKMATEEV